MAQSKNLAEYNPGSFTMDLTEVEWKITDETFPIYAHEYCHYIQDISTISGISGFYYKIIDIAELTKITCDGTSKIITIPIQTDKEGHPIRKNKGLYAYYCGHVTSFDCDFTFDPNSKETKEITIGKTPLNIPLFKLFPSGQPEILVGTYALQEAHAFYIQKIIESDIIADFNKKDIKFKISTDSLPRFPYKFVDFLFDLFNLQASDLTKAYITELCLDTFLPMVSLIKVLEILKEKGMVTDKNKLSQTVLRALLSFNIPSAIDIQNIISEFLKRLIEDENRDYFRKGITWYLEIIYKMRELRNERAYWIPDSLSSYTNIRGFMNLYPPPIILKDNQISYFKDHFGKPSGFTAEVLDSVTILFLYMHIFSMATELNRSEFNKLVSCPLYENCQIRKCIHSDYVCKTAPWKIAEHHKEKDKVCFYRKALMELGLDQNKIDVMLKN